MNQEIRDRLENFADIVYHLGKESHNTPQEFPKAVHLFVKIYRELGYVHPDDVKHFFEEKGWRAEEAHSIGYLADVVHETMRELGALMVK